MDDRTYRERVYAGVLGKLIGVYSGRPIEGWTIDQIAQRFGEARYYINERLGVPLIVTDDDIAGTFTFVRALEDHGRGAALTSHEIGLTWLDYVIEERTTFWWGGRGVATEHTAFLNLQNGIKAPASGSRKANGETIASQIGAQIFIDGWAMLAPGDPKLAARLAREAARVSHDGVAVEAAQLIAAMEAEAFVQPDTLHLLEVGLSLLPSRSPIVHLAEDVADWVMRDGDWRDVRAKIELKHGYDKYPGNCHIIPNHALVLLSLLTCGDDFQRALTIVNSSGWDTDCNAGNVGCLMGIKNGLVGLDTGADFRSPLADRMFVPSAEPGEAITDGVREAVRIVNARQSLLGNAPFAPKGGARFHFDFPGSVQGFHLEDTQEGRGVAYLGNAEGHSRAGERSLKVCLQGLAPGRCVRVATDTFAREDVFARPGYGLVASPTLYQGQMVRYALTADIPISKEVRIIPFVTHLDGLGAYTSRFGPLRTLVKGERLEEVWHLDLDIPGPIYTFGFELSAEAKVDGALFVDYVDWGGVPTLKWHPAALGTPNWEHAWSITRGSLTASRDNTLVLDKFTKQGLAILGTRDWTDYRVSSRMHLPRGAEAGIAVRVRGQLRYLALLILGNVATVAQMHYGRMALASRQLGPSASETQLLEVVVQGNLVSARVNGLEVARNLKHNALSSGAAALIITGGPVTIMEFAVEPLTS